MESPASFTILHRDDFSERGDRDLLRRTCSDIEAHRRVDLPELVSRESFIQQISPKFLDFRSRPKDPAVCMRSSKAIFDGANILERMNYHDIGRLIELNEVQRAYDVLLEDLSIGRRKRCFGLT